jgi:hypothetical protein
MVTEAERGTGPRTPIDMALPIKELLLLRVVKQPRDGRAEGLGDRPQVQDQEVLLAALEGTQQGTVQGLPRARLRS